MAGAGYKLFATGDVLTAAQVNTYLMQQSVMVFASAAARTSAISGVLAEGMVTYLQDTNSLEFYDGSGWVAAVGDVTGITASSPLTGGGSSGAITVGIQDATTSVKGAVQLSDSTSTTSSILASTPTATKSAYDLADSAYAPAFTNNFYAGKNKLINGDFNINQRSFTSTTTNAAYGFDRWRVDLSDGTVTYSAQTFTPGTAPVTGYEAANFARVVTTGQTATSALAFLNQRIENVRTFANQTIVVSFWAKAAAGTPKIAVELDQQFGSGGSTRVTTYAGQVTLSTSWARYSVSVAVPSLSGKTIGTPNWLSLNLWVSAGSDFNSRTGSMGIQTGTFDFWGVQIEAGSTASPFQTASGSIGGELALCQRYYYQWNSTLNSYTPLGTGFAETTTVIKLLRQNPVQMRVSPTLTITGPFQDFGGNGVTVTASALLNTQISLDATAGSAVFTAWQGRGVRADNSLNAKIEVTSEL